MWPFGRRRKPESPEERAAEARLDEATREVAADELTKEARREAWRPYEPLGFAGGTGRPGEDPDPGDERGLRDALRGDDS